MKNVDNTNEIKYLSSRDAVRTRPGLYLGSVSDPHQGASLCLREILDNSCDEISSGFGDTILVSNNFNGFCFVADNGRGIPIQWSKDRPATTQAFLSIDALHAGSKFGSTDASRAGQYGVGSSVINYTSEIYCLLSKIDSTNYKDSIPEVRKVWESTGPRGKKDLYYVVITQKGIKQYEGAGKLKDIEKMIFSGIKNYVSIPQGQSTIVLFKPDPEIWEYTKVDIPLSNLQYFLLIQEKFFNRKVNIVIDGQKLVSSFKPYRNEILKNIIPADTSMNNRVGIYVTFSADKNLGSKSSIGSVNGLEVNQGTHIQLVESCFKTALKEHYKIKHDCLLDGFQFCVVLLAGEVVFDSQTKTRLRQISKVKLTDFTPLVKEFIKVFKSDSDFWDLHVERLNKLAESKKSIGAIDKAQKMIDSSSGVQMYRNKSSFIKGFVDATAGMKDRWNCELFIVEGLSAGQALISGRPDTKYYSIFPIRGKILNVTSKTADQALDSDTIYSMFNCIGLGIDANNVLRDCVSMEEAMAVLKQRSRYGKIIISTDNDPDGSMIANELLHLFGKFSRFMIDCGLVYRIFGPLFKGRSKKTKQETYYFPDDPVDPNTGFPKDLDLKYHISYYKGLGSLSPETGEIEDIFFDPNKRRLVQITSEGLDYMMEINESIQERKRLLYNNNILSNPYNFNDL